MSKFLKLFLIALCVLALPVFVVATVSSAPTSDPACPILDRLNLFAPSDGSTAHDQRVTLDWSDSNCIVKYGVVVRADSKKGVRVERAKKLEQSEYETKKLETGKTYFWRVKSCAGEVCARSEWFKFEVGE